jgi:hypothetical protein
MKSTRKESSLDLARHVTQSGGEIVKSFGSGANRVGIFWEVHLQVITDNHNQ